MKYINLKDTDLKLSNICLGTGNFGTSVNKEQAFLLLDEFVRQGGNFIDTANVYCGWVPGTGNSAEQFQGEWKKSRGADQNVVIATKGAHYDFARPDVPCVTVKHFLPAVCEIVRFYVRFIWTIPPRLFIM